MTEVGTSTMEVQKMAATALLGKALVDKGVRKRSKHQEEGRTLSGPFPSVLPYLSFCFFLRNESSK